LKTTLYDYCRTHDRPELLREWHPAKNAPLTPEGITYGSKRSVWWKCKKGHEWQTAVYTRAAGSGCPYCAGKRAWPGENDLASQRPDLATQWHPTKNNGVTPADIPLGSHHMAWWVCEKGHEWKAIVKSRAIGGTGCPVCANRALLPGINDLATTHPELARQWHPAKNGSLTPHDVMAGTRRKVWWRCDRGHEWQAAVSSRAVGTGCPVCAGKTAIPGENDLASLFPAIAAQWHPTRNGGLTPEKLTPYSNKKAWWLCPLGHEYTAAVAARITDRSGCPYCAGRKVLPGFNDLATLEPKVAAQWHPTLNGALTPEQVTTGSHKKVWWECPNGHIWKAVIYSRAGPGSRKCGCPVCAGRIQPERTERYRLAMAEHEKFPRAHAPKQNREKLEV